MRVKANVKKKHGVGNSTIPIRVRRCQLFKNLMTLVGRYGAAGRSDEAVVLPCRQHGLIRLCSDCAGLGTDVIALTLCGLKDRVRSAAWTECDAEKQKLYRAVQSRLGHHPGPLWKDITTRDHAATPACDLYVAGYPCPSFSSAGKRQGANDPTGRGLIAFHGLQHVCHHRPRICVLENVRGLLFKSNRPFLQGIRAVFKGLQYSFHARLLNTMEHGVPQSRPRLYMVAIRGEVRKFRWPEPLDKAMLRSRLHHFIDKDVHGEEVLDISSYESKLGRAEVWNKGYILDVGASKKFQHPLKGVSPCLTRARLRGKTIGFYIPKLRRRLTVQEASRLQAVPQQVLHAMLKAQAASGTNSVGGALGDSMSVNILMRVLPRALVAAGLLPPGEVRDVWAHASDEEASTLPDRLFSKHVGERHGAR